MKRDYGRTIFSWRIGIQLGVKNGEGMGEGYDMGIRKMVDAGLDYLEEHPETKETTEKMRLHILKVCDGASGAAYNEAVGDVWYIHKYGLNTFVKEFEIGRRRNVEKN